MGKQPVYGMPLTITITSGVPPYDPQKMIVVLAGVLAGVGAVFVKQWGVSRGREGYTPTATSMPKEHA